MSVITVDHSALYNDHPRLLQMHECLNREGLVGWSHVSVTGGELATPL